MGRMAGQTACRLLGETAVGLSQRIPFVAGNAKGLRFRVKHLRILGAMRTVTGRTIALGVRTVGIFVFGRQVFMTGETVV
jgi:hypothetical protein